MTFSGNVDIERNRQSHSGDVLDLCRPSVLNGNKLPIRYLWLQLLPRKALGGTDLHQAAHFPTFCSLHPKR